MAMTGGCDDSLCHDDDGMQAASLCVGGAQAAASCVSGMQAVSWCVGSMQTVASCMGGIQAVASCVSSVQPVAQMSTVLSWDLHTMCGVLLGTTTILS